MQPIDRELLAVLRVLPLEERLQALADIADVALTPGLFIIPTPGDGTSPQSSGSMTVPKDVYLVVTSMEFADIFQNSTFQVGITLDDEAIVEGPVLAQTLPGSLWAPIIAGPKQAIRVNVAAGTATLPPAGMSLILRGYLVSAAFASLVKELMGTFYATALPLQGTSGKVSHRVDKLFTIELVKGAAGDGAAVYLDTLSVRLGDMKLTPQGIDATLSSLMFRVFFDGRSSFNREVATTNPARIDASTRIHYTLHPGDEIEALFTAAVAVDWRLMFIGRRS